MTFTIGKNWTTNSEQYTQEIKALCAKILGVKFLGNVEGAEMFVYNSTYYWLSDNGGEINVLEVNNYELVPSIPYAISYPFDAIIAPVNVVQMINDLLKHKKLIYTNDLTEADSHYILYEKEINSNKLKYKRI